MEQLLERVRSDQLSAHELCEQLLDLQKDAMFKELAPKVVAEFVENKNPTGSLI